MKFHHDGIVCHNIEEEKKYFEALGYHPESDVFEDPEQKIQGLFMINGEMRIELLATDDPTSPIISHLKKLNKIYHQCFICENIDEEIEKLTNIGAVVASPPKKAVVFKRVAFILMPNHLLIELAESEK